MNKVVAIVVPALIAAGLTVVLLRYAEPVRNFALNVPSK